MKSTKLLRQFLVMVLVLLFSIYVSMGQSQTFTSSGTFTVPPGITTIIVECWGGGGAGGGSSASSVRGGGGGAGGAYAKKSITVTPGTSYTVTVGGTTTGTNSAGAEGSPSWFGTTSTVYAQGGGGGEAPNGGTVLGGIGSAALSIGDLVYAGGNGADGGSSASGGGGGGAGSTGTGGNASGTTGGTGTPLNGGNGGAGRTNGGNGTAGQNYGGGGSGAYVNNTNDRNGGNGAAGAVIISWSGTFTTSGTFKVPAGVTSITVECWGGGGAGGAATGNPAAGGGGAGGAYATKTLTVVTGTEYTVTVGSGGTGGSGNGAAGNPSWFGTAGTVYAQGGAGGALASANNSNGAGGTASASSSIGDLTYKGGNGATGIYTSGSPGGAGGGGAGSTGDGNNAVTGTGGESKDNYGGAGANGVSNSTQGANGNVYGGGGSGGKANTTTDRNGGNGANGLVIITCCYTVAMDYDYERNITIDHTKVAGGEDLYNFPALISLTGQNFLKTSPTGHIKNPYGYDIVFTDVNYNKLDHQIEYYSDTNGDLIAWVRIPVISSSTNTIIKILYGNYYKTTDPSVTSVWDSHYKGVWHLDNSNLNDFTSYNKSATPSNSPSYSPGQINNSLELNGSNQYATVLNAPNTNFAGNITVSAWVYMDTRTRDQKIAGNQNNSGGGYKFGIYTNNKVEFEIRNSANTPSLNRDVTGGTVLNTGHWYYLAGISSDVLDSIKTFVNGIPERPFKKTGVLGTSSNDLTIGKEPFLSDYYFDGKFDELRISDKVRSNGWMRTEYNNQSSPITFYSIDTEDTSLRLLSAGLCSSPITLTFGYPAGGTYSGNPYISGNIFTPPAAGTYSITYTYAGSCGPSSVTKEILITDIPSAPAAPDKEYCSNQITYLEATSGENFRWYSGGTLVSTANPFSTGQTAPGTYNYTVTQTINGCESPATNVRLTIYGGITIATQPQPQTICPGDNATFSVTASGYNTTYQWQENGVNISNGGIYSGATSSTLVLTNPDNSKNGKSYRCVISSSCGTSPVNSSAAILTINPGFAWNGSVSTDWNDPDNWSCGHVPGQTNSVLVTNTANQPVLSSGGAGIVKDLTIDNGASLIVNGNTIQVSGSINNNGILDASNGTIEFNGSVAQSIGSNVFENNTIRNFIITNSTGVTLNDTLKVSGIVTVNTGNLVSDGHLVLLSGPSQTALINGTGAGEVTGLVTMQRYLPSGFGYKYFSSPFQDSRVSQFGDDMDLGAAFPSVFRYDENRKLAGVPASGWIKYSYPDSLLRPMRGYSVNFGSVSVPDTADVTGIVNNGSMSLTLYNHNNPYTLGFNLVGNPYPSPIDWDAAGWTKTNIENAIHFFKASPSDQYGGTYSSYVGGVSTDPGVATNIIPSMQGFFVHVSNGAFPVTGTLGLDNSVRISDLTHSFIKSAQDESSPLLRLSAGFSEDPEALDKAVIYFDDNASTTFDSKFDALKLMNTDLNVPNFYSEGSDGSKLSINALPSSLITGCTIPLGIKISRAGNVVFKIPFVSSQLPVTTLYLADMTAGINQDMLSGNEYSVPLVSGDYPGRFFLYLNSSPTGITNLQNNELGFKAYFFEGRIVADVDLQGSNEGKIVITSLTGKQLFNTKIFDSGHYEFNPEIKPGLYIITFSTGNNRISRKIIAE